MNIFKLAKFYESKYGLKAEAASIQDVMNDVKKEIVNAYKLYVDPKTAKEPAIAIFAQAGEPSAAKILAYMTALTAKIDTLAAKPALFYRAVNKVLENINSLDKAMKAGEKPVERLPKESVRNQLRHYKRTLGTVLQRLSSILVKQAKILQKFLITDIPLAGGLVVPERKPLSKEKLLMFTRTPAAQQYGLDNLDVMGQILAYPPLRESVTTLINAIDRGHIPIDGPEVAAEAKAIREWLDRQKQTNLPALQQEPSTSPATLFEEEGEEGQEG